MARAVFDPVTNLLWVGLNQDEVDVLHFVSGSLATGAGYRNDLDKIYDAVKEHGTKQDGDHYSVVHDHVHNVPTVKFKETKHER